MTVRPVSVEAARLQWTEGGQPWSERFADIYHTIDGGLGQSRHVFIEGAAIAERWRGRDHFTILETGFGLGVNFLAAWDRLRADPAGPTRLHFVSCERHPLPREDLARALEPFEPLRPLAPALVAAWPPPLEGVHRIHFDGGRVILTLVLGDATQWLPQLDLRADALFLDGFSPSRNPALWSPEVVRELARLAAPGATLATWTIASGVRAALSGAGFRIDRREGFGHKREMLVGVRDGEETRPLPPPRSAVVVGGGLSGVLTAERLAARGIEVTLIEPRSRRANARAGLVRPVANVRDAMNAQVSRPAFLYALQHYGNLQRDGFHILWDRCGVLQLAADDNEARRFEAIVEAQRWPAQVLAFVDGAEATRLAGRPVRGAGWWMPMGASVSPESLAIAGLARAGERVRRVAARVDRVEREGDRWRALDTEGRVLGEATNLVLANAADAARLSPESRLVLSAVRGQVTYLAPDSARRLDVAVSGSGYVAPIPEGGFAIGATFQHDDAGEDTRASDHRENLQRVDSMIPGFADGLHPMALEGWAGHRTTVPDRLPLFGETAQAGLWIAAGLGSRGLLWAPLGAELIASRLAGEPCPLSAPLAGAVSPRRFLS